MCRDAQGPAEARRSGKGKGKAFVISVRVARRSRRSPFSVALHERGKGRRLGVFARRKFLEADRQRSFGQADSVPDLAQIVWILGVTLLITRVVKMEKEPFVRQIRFQHSGAGVRHPDGKIMVVHLEDEDILQLVALFFPDVNLSARKLIDHLVAAKTRRILARVEDLLRNFPRGGGDGYLCQRKDVLMTARWRAQADASRSHR